MKIIALMIAWSLCAVYITRFLETSKMKAAAAAFATLFAGIFAVVYALFLVDVRVFGISDSINATRYGSDVYHAFLSLDSELSLLTQEQLAVLIALSVTFLAVLIAFFVISGARFLDEIAHGGTPARTFVSGNGRTLPVCQIPWIRHKIYLVHCRWNN